MIELPALLLAGGDARFMLLLLIVFGSAKLLGEIAEWLRQPAIVGQIIAGMLIGPSVLNWVQPDELLTAAAELGVLFLLFRVGLEVKPGDLFKVGGQALAVALGGVLLPFLGGWMLSRAYGHTSIESIFVGAALVATSIGITAQVLSAKGVLDHRASRIILAAAVFDDILGLLVLAAVSSMAKGPVNVTELAVSAGMAIGFTLLVAIFGSRAAKAVFRRAQNLRASEAQFNVALIVLFALAVLAAKAGVASIIGAFLAGMALSESVDHRVHDLAQGINELFVPFFLAGIGLSLDVHLFQDPAVLTLAALMTVVAVATKLIGCGLPALRLGMGDVMRIGCGMVPRGEVGLVVANLGASLGVIEPPVYAAVVFMAVVSTMLGPALVSWSFRSVAPAVRDPAQPEPFSVG